MSKKWIVGAALVAALAVPALSRAHEGHAHKIMGTVMARHENRLEIKTKDGKTVTVVLGAKTTYEHGKMKADDTMLKVGDRVVVEVDGKDQRSARTVRIGVPAAAKK
jgi:hypothetical protein